MYEDCYKDLARAVLVQAINDYIGYKKTNDNKRTTQEETRKEIERFLRSERGKIFLAGAGFSGVSVDAVIMRLKYYARKRDNELKNGAIKTRSMTKAYYRKAKDEG